MNPKLQKEVGKYLVDVSKLVIGGAVLSTVINLGGIPKSWILIIGVAGALIFAIGGFILMNEKE